jgi:hypothetical protein
MDAAHLDVQVLSLNSPGIQAEPDAARAVTRAGAVNDLLAGTIEHTRVASPFPEAKLLLGHMGEGCRSLSGGSTLAGTITTIAASNWHGASCRNTCDTTSTSLLAGSVPNPRCCAP